MIHIKQYNICSIYLKEIALQIFPKKMAIFKILKMCFLLYIFKISDPMEGNKGAFFSFVVLFVCFCQFPSAPITSSPHIFFQVGLELFPLNQLAVTRFYRMSLVWIWELICGLPINLPWESPGGTELGLMQWFLSQISKTLVYKPKVTSRCKKYFHSYKCSFLVFSV